MKIELKSREGSVYKKLCSSVSEANNDTELIVPDSLEDILRILSCRHQCRIREKNVGQDAVSVSGEIDVTVMYIPETGDGVRVVGTTIPFEINFSAPGADSTSSAVTKLLALNADAKRNVTIAAVLLLVCAAVYLNWSYNNKWGTADPAMVKAEDAAMKAANEAYEAANTKSSSGYFAEARLNRQVSRDEAIKLLEDAVKSDTASQETIDSAMTSISAMANYSMKESQLENKLLAKDFSDCVVYMSEDSITVAVPAPRDGLSEAAVARITETVTSETSYTAAQLNVIEVPS